MDFYEEESLLQSVGKLKQDGLNKNEIMAERKNIARNLFDVLDDEVIASKTGLTLKEVKDLKNE